MNALKRITLATIAAAALGPLSAQAFDVTVVNSGNVMIHPYFRNNCWDPAFSTVKNEWVFFGGILAGTQFTWPQMELLGDPTCRNPYLEFTYVEHGEAPIDQATPARPTRVLNLKPASLSTVFVIRLETGVMIDQVQQSN